MSGGKLPDPQFGPPGMEQYATDLAMRTLMRVAREHPEVLADALRKMGYQVTAPDE